MSDCQYFAGLHSECLRPIYGREYIHPAGNVLLCKPHFARAVKRREEREERDLDATREKVLV